MLPFNVASHLCCYLFFRVLGGLAHHIFFVFSTCQLAQTDIRDTLGVTITARTTRMGVRRTDFL